nr:hypothetical protein GCM10025732_56930 [Glycomyces mayteni]
MTAAEIPTAVHESFQVSKAMTATIAMAAASHARRSRISRLRYLGRSSVIFTSDSAPRRRSPASSAARAGETAVRAESTMAAAPATTMSATAAASRVYGIGA